MAKKENDKKNQKSFWKDFKAEIKKVIWPTKKQLANNTMVVIAMVLVTALIVLVLDLAFEALNTYGINKIKEVVQESISTSEEETTEDDTTDESSDSDTDESTDSEEETSSDETETNSEEIEIVDETTTEDSENNETEE